MNITDLLNALNATRFHFSTEDELQRGVAEKLTKLGIEFIREHQLDKRSRVDFYIPHLKVGIECKIAGSLAEIAAQVQRYCLHEDIASIIVISRRGNVAQIPDEVAGKPVHKITLWRLGL